MKSRTIPVEVVDDTLPVGDPPARLALDVTLA